MNVKGEMKRLIGLEFNESSYAEEVSKLLQNLDIHKINVTIDDSYIECFIEELDMFSM